MQASASRIRPWAIVSSLIILGCTNGSEDTPLNRWEVYSSVLAKITDELHLDHTLAVHPLLGLVSWVPGGGAAGMDAFNLSDTLVIRSFVNAHNSEYHVCTLTRQRTCDLLIDEVYVILSDLEEVGERQIGVLAIVVDHRSPPGSRDYYTANLQPRRGKWRVVSFRRFH